MPTGTISKLVPLSSQSELANSEAVSGHNSVGYGHIRIEGGADIYFPHDAISGCSFDELRVGQEVEFDADPQQGNFARRVVLRHDDAHPRRAGTTMPPGNASLAEQGSSARAGGPITSTETITVNHQEHPDLQTALAEFERQLLTPVVPGELATWLEAIRGPMETAMGALRHAVTEEHPDNIESIGREDPELQRRTEQLHTEAHRLLEEVHGVTHDLDRIQPAVETDEPNEAKAADMVNRFVERAVALIISARKQEQAIKVWAMESLERDRGDVD